MSESTAVQMLDPAALSELGNLEIVATRVVEGLVSGIHRSPFQGSSVEFAEHRLYTPGDDLRSIDWRAYAKSDRYYVKQYEAETNMKVTMVLDASGSMGFGLSTISKFRYGQITTACLSKLLLGQRDAVGLALSGGSSTSAGDLGGSVYIPPRSVPSQLSVMIDSMTKAKPDGPASMASALAVLGRRLRRRGLVVVLSDCFEDLGRLIDALHGLRVRGHDLMLIHIMAPEELSFSFGRWSRFECLEISGRRRDLDPRTIRKRYLQQVADFLQGLKDSCAEIRCDYAPMTTDKPIGAALSYYLRLRDARVRKAG